MDIDLVAGAESVPCGPEARGRRGNDPPLRVEWRPVEGGDPGPRLPALVHCCADRPYRKTCNENPQNRHEPDVLRQLRVDGSTSTCEIQGPTSGALGPTPFGEGGASARSP